MTTKEKLAAMIEEAIPESTVYPDNLRRSYDPKNYQDIHRWEGIGQLDGRTIQLYSWETMTDLVKHGIVVTKEKFCQYDISIKT